MKKILGLDLGTTSIGWAFVKEAENESEKSEIVRLGVRVVPLTTDEEGNFQKGKSITTNADRTLKRSARKNLDRYQLRRQNLIEILKEHKIISDKTILTEVGKGKTHSSYELRSLAATERIELEDFARVLLMINKKRGYKSSRKVNSDEEGTLIDGMEIAKKLYEENSTPGAYVYQNLLKGNKTISDFYRSDLQAEFDAIWDFQSKFYPDVYNAELKKEITGKGKKATAAIIYKTRDISTVDLKGKREEKLLQAYKLRAEALSKKLEKDQIAFMLCELNNDLSNSSGYLGAISDRSKELFFNGQTVGQYQYEQLKNNPNTSLKNMVFYRQDYMDEFETIWEMQAKYHHELSPQLKAEIRDIIIFYQRRLKSQKHLISECEFEQNHKVIPKSSPLFQEFKIWSILNNLEFRNKETHERFVPALEDREFLYEELNIRDKLSEKEALKLLVENPSKYELNYKELEGNRTNSALIKTYIQILEMEGVFPAIEKLKARQLMEEIESVFIDLGIDKEILTFNTALSGNDFDKQPAFRLWHMLYSFEGDNSKLGNENLLKKLQEHFGFKPAHAKILANINLKSDYGNLSARAIRKILPHLKEGNTYDKACLYAKYNHSSSLNKEELTARSLKNFLELLPKNSLRNPVVEKILNQMVNVVNAIFKDPQLGKPDEIRIELARELKKSAKEREDATKSINKATTENEIIRQLLQKDFGIKKVTRNDIIRYKLYQELETIGYKDIYSGEYIPREKIFSKEFDIEHIIPQARLFDDSFSNKTLSLRKDNIEKGDKTAFDFVKETKSSEEFNQFVHRVESLFRDGKISRTKYTKLLMPNSEIPNDFIERDLRDSQYIARKARQMLFEAVREVTTTTGSITDRLRQDWQLVNVLKELNLPKYRTLGLTQMVEDKNGQASEQIIDWTKRNDHRHHAMDALTVAFTKRSYVQYLNNMNARGDRSGSIYGIEQKELYRDKNKNLLFIPPIPLDQFRAEAKKQLESVLISFKAKNKVVTWNINKTKQKGKDKYQVQTVLTPRGQLHNETVYGKRNFYVSKYEKVGARFDSATIRKVADKKYREALMARLNANENNPKKAFTGSNSLLKNPLYTDQSKTEKVPESVKLVWQEHEYTIRKEIGPDLKIEKVIDPKIREKLKEKIAEFGGDTKAAFTNKEKKPIWLNEEKGIQIKRVRIKGVNNVEALHYKRDQHGNAMIDQGGNVQPVDFVSTGNNHHVAIYQDEQGKLQEEVVSFYEAVHRVNEGIPIIKKDHESGWKFLFTMKQNEYFVFPSADFDPAEIDLMDPDNYSLISKHLFRVQKIARKNYVFNHHLETKAVDDDLLKNKLLANSNYYLIQTPSKLEGIIKIRIDHTGKICFIGEY